MKITKLLECKLTPEELQRYGMQLAHQNQELARLEDRKKRAMSQLKSEIDAAQAEINCIAQTLARGYEEREVECEILYNTPEDGIKTIRRTDTGETIQVLQMSREEKSDLFINALGARKDSGEFVFRNKKRCRMISADEYTKILDGLTPGCRLDIVKKDLTELALVDIDVERPVLSLVVYAIDEHDKQKEWFDLYRYAETKGAPEAPKAAGAAEDADPDPEAEIAGAGEARTGCCAMCGEEGRRTYHAGTRMLCEACMMHTKGALETASFLAALHDGDNFYFRAVFGFGCVTENHETTCFRIKKSLCCNGGWKFDHYRVGDYRVEGTDAYAYAKHLVECGGIEA